LIKDQLSNPDIWQNWATSVGADADQVSKVTQLGLPACSKG
jgi:hypothetical protein